METSARRSSDVLGSVSGSGDISYLQTIVPPEVLLVILIFLSPRDKLRLRATCRRLNVAVSDSAAWPTVSFHYCRPSDKKRLDKVVDLCLLGSGPTRVDIILQRGVQRFPLVHFMDRISALTRVCHLSLLGFEKFSEVSEERHKILRTVHSFKGLTHLKLDAFYLGIDSKRSSWWVPRIPSLVSLEIRAAQIVPHTIRKALVRWSGNKLWPRTFRLSSRSIIRIDIRPSFQFDPLPPGESATFQLMQSESPLCILPSRPFLELVVSRDTCSLPVVYFGGCHLLLTHSFPVSVTSIPPMELHRILVDHLLVETPFLSIASTLVHLSLKDCPDITSDCLKEIATHCPLLESLDIGSCSKALSPVDGLLAVSKKCLRLRGLNVSRIHCIGDLKAFWQVLSNFRKLSSLSMEYCFLPVDSELEQETARVVSALISLQIGSMLVQRVVDNCIRCRSASDRYLRILGWFVPSNLRLLRMTLPSTTIGGGIRDLLTVTPNLQCIFLDKCCPGNLNLPIDYLYYQRLEKFYLKAWSYNISCEFIEALSHRKRLTHFYVKIRTISSDAVGRLLQLPNLVSCHIICKSRAYNKSNIYRAAKAQGIMDFTYTSELSLQHHPEPDTDFKTLF